MVKKSKTLMKKSKSKNSYLLRDVMNLNEFFWENMT